MSRRRRLRIARLAIFFVRASDPTRTAWVGASRGRRGTPCLLLHYTAYLRSERIKVRSTAACVVALLLCSVLPFLSRGC